MRAVLPCAAQPILEIKMNLHYRTTHSAYRIRPAEARDAADIARLFLVSSDGLAGVVTLPRGSRRTLQRVLRSSCSGRRLPRSHSFAAKLAQCLARNQVSLDVEGVVDGGVYCKKSLS